MTEAKDYSLEVCDMCHFQYGTHGYGDLLACLRATNHKLWKIEVVKVA